MAEARAEAKFWRSERIYRVSIREYRLVTKADMAAERAVGLGEIGGFGVDPKDSAALLELRAAIDDHLGWRNEKEEHAGDYVARVKQVGGECRVGVPCQEHSGVVHGQEAEELRKGIERILEEETTDDMASALRELLDSVDARDSLSFLEARKALARKPRKSLKGKPHRASAKTRNRPKRKAAR
jgi:hypothetical protein